MQKQSKERAEVRVKTERETGEICLWGPLALCKNIMPVLCTLQIWFWEKGLLFCGLMINKAKTLRWPMTYLYAWWVCFWLAFFSTNNLTILIKEWWNFTKMFCCFLVGIKTFEILAYILNHIFKKNVHNFANPTTHFPLTSANKPQGSKVLYLQVWSQSWPYKLLHKMLVKFNLKMLC